MILVRLVIGIPKKDHIHKHLLAEKIVGKVPDDFISSKDLLFTKQPLTLKVVKEHILSKIRSLGTSSNSIVVKDESAMAAVTKYCENRKHNPSNLHSKDKCWQLNPDLNRKKKKEGKKQAKVVFNDESDNETVASKGAFLSIKKQQAFSCHS